MASATFIKTLREETTCPICLKLMTEPMSIDCGHSYCCVCIMVLTQNQSSETSSPGTFNCPKCRKPFQSGSLRPNKQLKGIIEIFKEMIQNMCNEHGEQLHLFCENDGQLICWCCERSSQHKGHLTATVEDACPGYREKLQKAVTKLKITESKYMQLKLDATQKISSWEEKIKHEKERIHSEFKKLHTFMHLAEQYYMHSLEKEKEQKLIRLKNNVAHLDKKVEELKNSILELDKKCQDSAQTLLQGIKDTLSRVSAINLETPEDVSLELHTVRSVSELHLSMRKILRRHQVNVSSDADTINQKIFIGDPVRPCDVLQHHTQSATCPRPQCTEDRSYSQTHAENQIKHLEVKQLNVEQQVENNKWVRKEVKEDMKKYLETNENKDTSYPNLQDEAKAVIYRSASIHQEEIKGPHK